MGKKSRRAVYDPSIMDRVDDIQPLDPDPLAFGETDLSMPEDSYETQETEILDPKLHRTGPSKNRTRFICLSAIVTAGLIAIIVTVSVIVAKNNQSKGSSSNPNSQQQPEAGPDGIVPTRNIAPVPSNLESSCVQGYNNRNSDPTGYQACIQACQVAECCNLPSNFELSCLKGNEETCLDYHQACHVLTLDAAGIDQVQVSSEIVPPAPADLPQLCAVRNLTTNAGIRNCATECLPYECCYETGVVNCQAANPTTCDTYAPCLNLRAIDAMNGNMEQEVAQSCEPSYAATLQGRLDCRKTCKLAQCCFTGNKQCGDDHPADFCTVQYKPCEVLYDGSLPHLEIGDDDTLPGNGEDDDYYYDDAYYDDDEILNGTTQNDDGVTDDDVVIDDTVAFGTDQEYDDAMEHPTLPNPPADIATTCDPTTVATNKVQAMQCREVCKKAQCCLFEAQLPQSCLLGNNLKCMEYQRHCGAIFGNPDESTYDVQTAPPDISQVCSPVSLATEQGMEKCQNTCTPAQCCYDWSVASCGTDKDCASFAPCLNLQAMTQNHDSVEEVVDKLCTPEEVVKKENRAECLSVCLQHTCCWDNYGEPCPPEIEGSCRYYTGCKFLHNNSSNPAIPIVPLDAAPKNLQDLCAQSDTTDCKTYCNKATCCEIPQYLEGSCLYGNHDKCLRYALGCSVLTIGDGENATVQVNEAPPDLIPYCSVESLANSYGRQKCQELCDPAKCCWSLDLEVGESCRDQSNCLGYSPCMILRSGFTENDENTDYGIEEDVSKTCTNALISTPQGMAACQAVCSQHTCCWDVLDDATEMCWGNTTCAQYDACSILLDVGGDDYADDPNGGDRTRKERRGLLRQ